MSLTFDLRSNSSPRSLCAYVAPAAAATPPSSSTAIPSRGATTSTNPFDSPGAPGGTNPFDTATAGGRRRAASDAQALAGGGAGGTASSSSAAAAVVSVVFGTERGALHYRAYPASAPTTAPAASSSRYGSSASSARSSGVRHHGGRSNEPLQPLGTEGLERRDRPEQRPVDLMGAVPGAVVAVLRAEPPPPSAVFPAADPVFLLLVDDNRGSGSASGSSPGAYASHLVTLKRGSFVKLPPAPVSSGLHHHHAAGASDGGASGSVGASSHHLGSLGALPRMSCASYHPDAGFVYAAGTGVYSLPPNAVRAVSAALVAAPGSEADDTASSSSRRSHHRIGSVGSAPHHPPFPHPPAVHFRASRALPSPGVRSGGAVTSMALACRGRVAVCAVTNAFYAVTSLPVISNHHGDDHHQHHHPDHGGGIAGGGGGEATKLLTFARSSQVHPVIVLEVPRFSSSSSDHGMGDNRRRTTRHSHHRRHHRDDDQAEHGTAAYLDTPCTSVLFLASGRECAAVEITFDPRPGGAAAGSPPSVAGDEGGGEVTSSPPRHGIATLASPILAAATVTPDHSYSRRGSRNGGSPLVAVLTSDGLVHTRSPGCIAIPLSTVEVGTRPNDFFVLRPLPRRRLVAASYGGEARMIVCRSDTVQDLADRLMKLSIDAFGANGFPRSELAEAVSASFSATSYVGPEPMPHARNLLRQYLEAVLGLSDDFGGDLSSWPADDELENEEIDEEDGRQDESEGMYLDVFDLDEDRHHRQPGRSRHEGSPSSPPAALLSGTALLCLVCYQLSPPNASLANRAAKSCAAKIGTGGSGNGIPPAAATVCELIADKLLKEASTTFSLLSVSSPTPIASSNRTSQTGTNMEFLESAVWLLRSCGRHKRAIEVLQERMNNPTIRNKTPTGGSFDDGEAASSGGPIGGSVWSQIKFESYTATHLCELWSSREEQCCDLVLRSPATRRLLENNPQLGLSVFTAPHPQNESQWRAMVASDDPLAHPHYPAKVVELLKSVNPAIPYEGGRDGASLNPMKASPSHEEGSVPLPLDSGRALAVSYLESAVGISTGRPVVPSDDAFSRLAPDETFEERASDLHDELSYLLLEGVISERGDEDGDTDTELGMQYRGKLRRLLSWPNAKVRSERLLASLPSSFLREHALLLGRLGRHEDALRILYCDLQSLELALEYCDARHEHMVAQLEHAKAQGDASGLIAADRDEMERRRAHVGCAYLPLVRVALESDPNSDRGTAAAIQVLALRRGSIDRSAALRLLPQNVPVSAVARPFLIPALVDSESQVRRLTVAASLLRAKYVDLKRSLTEAQIKSQASLHAVPALKQLNLGEPLTSSKPFKARPAHSASTSFPDVIIVKHFFPRHMVIQAKVTNSAIALDGRALGDVAFVVAESSDEAILPTMQVPVKTLPPKSTGSAWCVLAASPQRLDGTASLACELRYTILAVDTATGAPLSFSGGLATTGFGRTYVEELQDIEVRHTEFES